MIHKPDAEADGEPMKQQIATAAVVSQATETEISAVELPENPGSPNASFDLEGKVVIDLKDPNRPRFTLQELRQVS